MRKVHLWASATCTAVALAFGAPLLAAQCKPANATAQCKDGTYSTAKSKSGACSDHGGIQTWYADEAKSDTKTAAKATKDAAKDTGKATADASKSAAKTTANAAKTAGKATESGAKSA